MRQRRRPPLLFARAIGSRAKSGDFDARQTMTRQAFKETRRSDPAEPPLTQVRRNRATRLHRGLGSVLSDNRIYQVFVLFSWSAARGRREWRFAENRIVRESENRIAARAIDVWFQFGINSIRIQVVYLRYQHFFIYNLCGIGSFSRTVSKKSRDEATGVGRFESARRRDFSLFNIWFFSRLCFFGEIVLKDTPAGGDVYADPAACNATRMPVYFSLSGQLLSRKVDLSLSRRGYIISCVTSRCTERVPSVGAHQSRARVACVYVDIRRRHLCVAATAVVEAINLIRGAAWRDHCLRFPITRQRRAAHDKPSLAPVYIISTISLIVISTSFLS